MNLGLSVCARLDLLDQPQGQVRHALFEFVDGLAEILVGGLRVGEERIEQVGKLPGVGQVDDHGLLAVLVELGLPRVLENDVAGGIALGDLLLDLRFEMVVAVFRFPVAAGDVVVVAESAVGPDRLARRRVGKLWNEGPAELPAELLQQVLEGRCGGRFRAALPGAHTPGGPRSTP